MIKPCFRFDISTWHVMWHSGDGSLQFFHCAAVEPASGTIYCCILVRVLYLSSLFSCDCTDCQQQEILHVGNLHANVQQVMILGEVEEILEVVDAKNFKTFAEPLFQHLAKSVLSPHFQVRLSRFYLLTVSVCLTGFVWFRQSAVIAELAPKHSTVTLRYNAYHNADSDITRIWRGSL